MAHVKMARLIVPKQSQAWNNMKLSGQRRKDMAGWLMQTQAFYEHAPAVDEALAQRGITREELTQVKKMIEAVSEARVEQNRRKGSKQVAKVRRDEERKALQQWMRKYTAPQRFVPLVLYENVGVRSTSRSIRVTC